MPKITIVNCPPELEELREKITTEVTTFAEQFSLLEKDALEILVDRRTNAVFGEWHIPAKDLIELGTIDVPLDPENQPDYRANREFQEAHSAYRKMVDDANKNRMFSNIVCEFKTDYQSEKPLKVIGGQHRYLAIEDALKNDVNEYQGIKIYFLLNKVQRLDAQLISNTNISVATDLLDRMFETSHGPELRDWCQKVGLLETGEDFSDKKQRGSQLTVRGARTFILNYFVGQQVHDTQFDKCDTTPMIPKTGIVDEEWEKLRKEPGLWDNLGLLKAGEEFAKLNKAQKEYYKTNPRESEFSEKAIAYSVVAAWAFVAGVLLKNEVRLKNHFELCKIRNTDPLSSNLLAKAKHKTDPENFRGLGTRMEPKDRGRLAELFFLQANRGEGFNKAMVDLAIKKYHAKQSNLEVEEAEKKFEQ